MLDWELLGKVLGPLLGAVFGGIVTRLLERRPRVVSFIGHISSFVLRQGLNSPIDIFTHAVVFVNSGRSPAHNLRLGHTFLPEINIHPAINYSVNQLPNGSGVELLFPIVAPGEQFTISYLYYPPATWDKVNTYLKYDEGLVRVIRVLPTRQYPPAFLWTIRILLFIGVAAVGYLAMIALIAIWKHLG